MTVNVPSFDPLVPTARWAWIDAAALKTTGEARRWRCDKNSC